MKYIKAQEKKGLTLSDAFPAVLTVAVLAILIVALLYLFTALAAVPADITRSVVNETLTPTSAGVNVANYAACGFANFAVTNVYNGSKVVVINSGNYTTTAAGTIVNTTSTFTQVPWNVTYTYTDKGTTCTAANTFTTQYTTQIPLIGLVLTIVLIAIVIGVLVSSFFSQGKERV